MDPLRIAKELVRELKPLRFRPPVAYVYNPLEYAWGIHEDYLRRFGSGRREVLLLGMNPGPWGMAQTGVPFGEVNLVRDWMGLEGKVDKPKHEHPKRPVEGFKTRRSEISGARLWGWARDTFKTPERFFERFFILNYCPLSFMESGGKNLTPDKLAARERTPLEEACDRALRRQVEYYRPKMLIGIGAFAQKRALKALAGMNLEIGTVLHPSPASPAANRGWAKAAEKQFRALGVL